MSFCSSFLLLPSLPCPSALSGNSLFLSGLEIECPMRSALVARKSPEVYQHPSRLSLLRTGTTVSIRLPDRRGGVLRAEPNQPERVGVLHVSQQASRDPASHHVPKSWEACLQKLISSVETRNRKGNPGSLLFSKYSVDPARGPRSRVVRQIQSRATCGVDFPSINTL